MTGRPMDAVGVSAHDALSRHTTRTWLTNATVLGRVNVGGPTWWKPRGDVRVVRTPDGIAGVEVRVGWLRVAAQLCVAGTTRKVGR